MATKQNTGVVDSSGNPVLDGSGNPIMSGRFPDEDEITARGRARNAAMFKSFANRLTGKNEEAKKPAPAVSRPTRPGQETSGSKPATSMPTRPGQQVSGQNFGQAFAAARKAGDKTFTFKGKSFTTETKEDVDKRRSNKAKPSTPAAVSRPTRPGQQTSGAAKPKGKTASDYSRSSDAMRNLTRQKAAVTTFPSQVYDTDTDRMRNVSRSAVKDAGGKRAASAAAAKAPPPAEKRKALAISPGVLKQREADEKRRAERKEFGRQRDEKKKESFGMKKGGKVCMASKRADGIAVKGKTRGMVY